MRRRKKIMKKPREGEGEARRGDANEKKIMKEKMWREK